VTAATETAATLRLEGTVHVYGDNVDTDVIIPARYLTTSEPSELAPHCLEALDPGFAERCGEGDFLVAGRNMGCGSSREHAPLAIKGAGVACIVAASFARIFYRNAINVGLPIVECPEAVAGAETGDRFRVDLESGLVENVTQGTTYTATPLPEFMQEILRTGGLMPWVRERLGADGRPGTVTATDEPAQADWRLD
jgi:3-isopropylmalate/(R)-2-methylmalate dehydratase small subunit